MSEKNNVNPDHYKIKGRDRQGEYITQGDRKREHAQPQARGDSKETFFPTSNDAKDEESDQSA